MIAMWWAARLPSSCVRQIDAKWMIDDGLRRVVRYYEVIGKPVPVEFRDDLARLTERSGE